MDENNSAYVIAYMAIAVFGFIVGLVFGLLV